MYNKIILIGRLGQDPELRYTTDGTPVANFNIAVNRPYTNKEGVRPVDWFRIVAWRKTAELCTNYLKKGQLVQVDGRLQIREYQTNEGETRTSVEVVAQIVTFLSPKPKDNDTEEGSAYEYSDEDVPF